MRTKITVAASLLTAGVLVVSGCGSDSSGTSSSASGSAQPSGSTGPGGGSGGPGGGMQEITAVNLNTDGASPGGANTADVVTAVNAFLATLDDTKRGTVEYDFTDNQARQTWSNFPATAVPREGIALWT
jgi:ABC-type glycerol-3-phosphate transport system substrate-binding protein